MLRQGTFVVCVILVACLFLIGNGDASITYVTSLTQPPVEIGYNYYGINLVFTSDGGGAAVVGRSVLTNLTFAIVFERVASGTYAMREPIPINGPLTTPISFLDGQERNAVRLSDDLNRLIISPAAGNAIDLGSFVIPATFYFFNAASQAYEQTQAETYANITSIDMTRDGLSVLIAANSTTVFSYKLDSTDTSTVGALYLLAQTITTNGSVSFISVDAYARTFAVGVDLTVQLYSVDPLIDVNNTGVFSLQTIFTPVNAFNLISLKLSGNGARIFITPATSDFDSLYVRSATYNSTTQTWSSLRIIGPTTVTSCMSSSDLGDVLLVVENQFVTPQLYFMYLCPVAGAVNCTLYSSTPSPPWSNSSLATAAFGSTSLYGMTTDCSQILMGYFIPETNTPPIGNGQPILYNTNRTCVATPVLPPFTPPFLPPVAAPVAPPVNPPVVAPFFPPIAPIAAIPLSPSITPKYSPAAITPPSIPPSPVAAPTTTTTSTSGLIIAALVISLVTFIAVMIYIACQVPRWIKQSKYKDYARSR